MHQLVAGWNLVHDILESDETTGPAHLSVRVRGYSRGAALPGDFRLFLRDNPGACLSVTDIAGGICPEAIDVYLRKSPHSPLKANSPQAVALKNKIRRGGYQQRAGNLFEDVLFHSLRNAWLGDSPGYHEVISSRDAMRQGFSTLDEKLLGKFRTVQPPHLNGGNPGWFLKQLECCIGQELGAYWVQKSLVEQDGSLSAGQVKPKPVIEQSDPKDIGIMKATPDFAVQSAKLIGEIKTGARFEYKYMLSCAGYAIAFEKRRKHPMDWGAVIFEPTEVCTALHQPMTFPQLYLFRISDELRTGFLEKRNRMYRQNQQEHIDEAIQRIRDDNSGTCHYCQRVDQCSELYGITP